jgi:hypothetical protein
MRRVDSLDIAAFIVVTIALITIVCVFTGHYGPTLPGS